MKFGVPLSFVLFLLFNSQANALAQELKCAYAFQNLLKLNDSKALIICRKSK